MAQSPSLLEVDTLPPAKAKKLGPKKQKTKVTINVVPDPNADKIDGRTAASSSHLGRFVYAGSMLMVCGLFVVPSRSRYDKHGTSERVLRRDLPCPVCRKVTKVASKESLNALPVNYAILKESGTISCANDCSSNATIYCPKCEADYCSDCAEKVHAPKALQSHSALFVAPKANRAPKPAISAAAPGPTCSLHNEPLKIWCQDDRTIIRYLCVIAGKHKNHDAQPIADAAAEERKSLDVQHERAKTEQTRLEQAQTLLRDHKQALEKSGVQTKESLQRQASKVKSDIDQALRTLKDRVDLVVSSESKALDEQSTKISAALTTLKAATKSVVESASLSPEDFLRTCSSTGYAVAHAVRSCPASALLEPRTSAALCCNSTVTTKSLSTAVSSWTQDTTIATNAKPASAKAHSREECDTVQPSTKKAKHTPLPSESISGTALRRDCPARSRSVYFGESLV